MFYNVEYSGVASDIKGNNIVTNKAPVSQFAPVKKKLSKRQLSNFKFTSACKVLP